MKQTFLQKIQQYIEQAKQRRVWHNVVRALGCVVVFCTTYALILPAITMETVTFCGLEEHLHSESCYARAAEAVSLVCQQTDGDVILHTHNGFCYDGQGGVICALAEVTEHTHSESCYTTATAESETAHQHSESCCTTVQGQLVCAETESTGHSHGESCYIQGSDPVCGLEETAGHRHADDCHTTVAVCTEAESEDHTHTESCSEKQLVCTMAETAPHIHTEQCFEKQRICTVTETVGHRHVESCYEQIKEFTCTLSEESSDTQTAEKQFVCTLAEITAHTHTESCYTDGTLACGKQQTAVHNHSESCAETQLVGTLSCTEAESEAHTHSEGCYTALICTKAEHTHSAACYADRTADIETAANWEAAFENIELTGDWPLDLVTVAQTQLGYTESRVNYAVAEDGAIKGYSRYGQWYGDVYADWNTLFLSFCANYAQIPQQSWPQAADTASLVAALQSEEYGLYKALGEYTPQVGDVVFIDSDGDTAADRVGIMAETIEETAENPSQIKTIEGDCAGAVQYVTYAADDAAVVGFGAVPRLTESQKQINRVISLIGALPTYEEIEATMAEYEAVEDYDGLEAWYTEVVEQVQYAYRAFMALDETQRKQVTNADNLMNLEFIWSVAVLDIIDTINVGAVNSYNSSSNNGALIVYNSTGGTVADAGMGESTFAWWYAIVVEPDDNGCLKVKAIAEAGEGLGKSAVYASGYGFTVLYHPGNYGGYVNVSVGDYVACSSDFWKTATAYNGTVLGTITFQDTPYTGKPEKDNTSKLDIVEAADTRELIEVNLYDFGTNINTLYNSDKKYPGFQQDNGTTTLYSSLGGSSFNFGNNITSDLAAGIGEMTNKGGSINATASEYGGVTYGAANLPIENTISKKLIDGYPALADGTSLGYLFSDSTYAAKQNTENINGLFQYNPDTGAYTFNSRENHAQFDAGSNTFTLYKQIISSNFMMYPFGNFLPFNDITKLSAQAKTIDRAYFLEIAESAQYRYNTGGRSEYSTLNAMLTKFIALMDSKYGTDWDAYDAVNAYFSTVGIEQAFSESSPTLHGGPLLDYVYSIDYDEKTDFYFGMDMKMNFIQPKNGLTGTTGQEPMEFYFTGDDDVWVYVDGALFLDLSGIHRHVGGKIDFVNGKIHYYNLDVAIGDVAATPYKTVTFEEAFRAAYANDADKLASVLATLNDKGTFRNYSSHDFNFYYMERGAGSGVCRMNFNFPLLRQNSISVSKEVTSDSTIDTLGNPDYKFQVLKADSSGNKTNTLFIAANTEYTVYDESGTALRTGTTDANGVITLKAGERAEFTGIQENAGKYYVRELLDGNVYQQYGTITVSGESTTTLSGITVGEDTFTGADSPVKDASDGATAFRFTNDVDITKTADITIGKTLTEYSKTRTARYYDIEVKLDNIPVPVGTAYDIIDAQGNVTETKTVQKAGIITVVADQKVKIANVLAGTAFSVKETSESAEGYIVTYNADKDKYTVTTDGVSGVIVHSTDIEIVINNEEKGVTVPITGTKTLTKANGEAHSFTFQLDELNEDGTVKTENIAQTRVENVTGEETEPPTFQFMLNYIQVDLGTLPQYFYYKVSEVDDPEDAALANSTVYFVTVKVEKDTDTGEVTAAVTEMRKDAKDGDIVSTADFVNTLSGDLVIGKTVNSQNTDDYSKGFTFDVTLAEGTSNATLPAEFDGVITTAGESGSSVQEVVLTTVDGKLVVKGDGTTMPITLAHNQSIEIKGIPYGATWTVAETNGAGYTIEYSINGGETAYGAAASGSVAVGDNTVTYTNVGGFILPETGGAGVNAYIMAGVLLVLGSLAGLIYKKRRKEVSP